MLIQFRNYQGHEDLAPREGLTGELSKPPAAALVKSFCSERAGKRHIKYVRCVLKR